MSHNMITNKQGEVIETDKEGYLKNLNDWSHDIAFSIAETEEITLNESHWEVITLLQQFHKEFDLSPAMRPLVKYIALCLIHI